MSTLRRMKTVARAALGKIRSAPPAVSVILPFYDVEEYLGESISSLMNQSLRDIEIILVDDGSHDGSGEVARGFAKHDRRIRVITQANAGPGAARNVGVAAARGEYLSFVDSDDRLPPNALEVLVNSARSNNADIAVGAVRRFDSVRRWVPEWVKGVHSESRRGTTLRDFPSLLRNNYPVGKVYRRAFWNEQGLAFRLGVIYEDQPLIAQMLLRAQHLNVLTDVVYEYRRRDDRSSISQRPEELRDLRDRVSAWRISLDALLEEAPANVIAGWYSTVYETHLHWYLNNDSIGDDEYWGMLRAALRDLREKEPADALERVSTEKRVAILLLDLDLRDDLVSFRNEGGYEPGRFESTVTSAGLVHALPLSETTLRALPASVLLTPAGRVPLKQQLVRGAWGGGGNDLSLKLAGSAYIPTVDLRSEPTRIEMWATNDATGHVIQATIRRSDDPVIISPDPGDSTNYVGSGYLAEFRVHDLVGDAGSPQDWSLTVRVSTGSLVVTEPLRNASPKGALTEMGSRMVGNDLRVRFALGENRHVGAKILFEEPAAAVETVSVEERSIRVTFRSTSTHLFVKLHFRAEGFGTDHVASVSPLTGGQFETITELPALAFGEAPLPPVVSWTVRVEDEGGERFALSWAEGRTIPVPVGSGTLRAYGAATGNLKLEEYAGGCVFMSEIEADTSQTVNFAATLIGIPGGAIIALSTDTSDFDAVPIGEDESDRVRFGVHFGDHLRNSDEDDHQTLSAVIRRAGFSDMKFPVVVSAVALEKLPVAILDSPLTLERTRGRALLLRQNISSG